jgi:glycosyltransferase involved in cell wall biosynthesis
MPTFVSLVIPVYNREAYLAATLDSILGQTYPHFELLLWDDQSTDGSLAIAQQYATQDARIRVVAAPHQGFTASLRAAFPLTLGSYIAWVDSDDVLAPTALTETVAILDQQPQVGLVYTDYIPNWSRQYRGCDRAPMQQPVRQSCSHPVHHRHRAIEYTHP